MGSELTALWDRFRGSRGIQIILLLCVTCLLYLHALPNQFVLDDDTFINWPLIKDLKNLPVFFTGTLPEEHLGDYRPLKGVVLSLNYALWGAQPVGYILQAIVIHAVAAVLVYLIIGRLIGSLLPALVGALVFILHPVQVEAIAFITSSSDIIGVAFYFAAFYAFLKSVNYPQSSLRLSKTSVRQTWRDENAWTILSLGCFTLGLLAYEMVLTLPLVCSFFLAAVVRRSVRDTLRSVSPYVLMVFIYVAIRFGILHVAGDETYQWGSVWAALLLSIVALARYVGLLFIPLRLQINHEVLHGIYAYRGAEIHPLTPPPSLGDPLVIGSILVAGLIAYIAARVYKKHPFITFCIGWFILTLLPVLNLYPLPALMTERYLYTALFGFAFLISVLVAGQQRSLVHIKKPKGIWITTIGLLLLFSFWGVRSYLRILDWRSSETLWSRELQENPDSMMAHHNLGMAYFRKGDMSRTLSELNLASERNFLGVPKVHLNLGKAYLATKDITRAKMQFETAVLYNPLFVEGYFYLANAEREAGQFSEAEHHYLKTLELDEKFYDARVQLAKLYVVQKKYDAAISQMREVIQRHPRIMPAYYDLAAMYIKVNKINEAKAVLEAGLKEDPQSESLKHTLAVVAGQ